MEAANAPVSVLADAPAPDAGQVHYSPSQLSTWSKCPRRWMYRYTLGLRLPPGAAAAVGKAVHEPQGKHFNEIIAGRDGLDTRAYVAAAADAFEREAADVDWAAEAGDGDNKALDRGSSLDRATLMARHYREAVAPTVGTPLLAEQGIELAVPGTEWSLLCYPDVVARQDGEVVVRDTKTAGKAPDGIKSGSPTPKREHALQLVAYRLAVQSFMGTVPGRLLLDYVWISARKGGPAQPNSVPVVVPAADDDVSLLLEDIDLMHRQIQAGLFPRRRTEMTCSPRWCGYWSRCIGPGRGRDL